MEMTVHGLNFDLTTAILEHVRQRLASGLSYYAPRVQRIAVRVSDVNGPCACSAPGSHVTSAAANATIRARAWRGDAGATVDRAGLAAGRYTSGHSSHPEALHDDRDRFVLLLRELHLLLHLRLHERPLLRQVLLRPLTRLDA